MKKTFLILGLLMLLPMAMAETVDPYVEYDLPQLNATRTLDLDGGYRTYLWCSWHIDGMGEEIVLMDSQQCPSEQQSFTFEGDETYWVRIDYAVLHYNGSDWNIVNTGKDSDIQIDYEVDIPEPPTDLIQGILDDIWDTISTYLCYWFGWFCS